MENDKTSFKCFIEAHVDRSSSWWFDSGTLGESFGMSDISNARESLLASKLVIKRRHNTKYYFFLCRNEEDYFLFSNMIPFDVWRQNEFIVQVQEMLRKNR